jgi:hypothetical protein
VPKELLGVLHSLADSRLGEICVNRYRDTNANLRTQLLRIIRRAGLKPWERLFHNLRASRQSELAGEYPQHTVCDWMENTPEVADRDYLQSTEARFRRAVAGSGADVVQGVDQPAAELAGAGSQSSGAAHKKGPGIPCLATSCSIARSC